MSKRCVILFNKYTSVTNSDQRSMDNTVKNKVPLIESKYGYCLYQNSKIVNTPHLKQQITDQEPNYNY